MLIVLTVILQNYIYEKKSRLDLRQYRSRLLIPMFIGTPCRTQILNGLLQYFKNKMRGMNDKMQDFKYASRKKLEFSDNIKIYNSAEIHFT